MVQPGEGGVEVAYSAVELYPQGGARSLQPHHALGLERRHGAVLLGRQTRQPRLTRVHHHTIDAGRHQRVDETLQLLVVVEVVDPQPVLHRHG